MKALGVTTICILAIGIAALFYPAFNADKGAPLGRHEIVAISVALDAYKSEFGAYPKGNSAEIGLALMGANSSKTTFIELRGYEKGWLLDPWGRPIDIQITPNEAITITSLGPDGKRSSDDVISIRQK